MKKMFLFLLLTLSLVAAQQVGVMNTQEGAEVRLLQLEEALAENIESGETVIAEILAENPDANVSDLQEVIAELEVLKEEVASLREADLNATEAAEEFVLVKEEANQLSRDFRTAAQGMLPEEAQERVRERARNATNEEVEQLREQVRGRINEHNAEQVQKFMQKMGKEDSQLVEQVRNGQMSTGQAISSVAKEYKGLGQEKRSEALAQVREEKMRAQVHKESVAERTQNMAQRIQERAEKRQGKVEQKLQEVQQRVNDRVANAGKDASKDVTGKNETPGGGRQ
ncbi:MAG: hypothetical protein ACQESG_06280 [Nanobdellota archaeon]